MADSGINLPSGSGGLMRFKEEYKSKFNLKPTHVIAFIISLVIFRIALQIFVK
jgi:preprotein translocase subunit Sec61beta